MSIQTSPIKDGDTLAVIHTNRGDIKVKLFPEYAPKTVANFVGLADKGYYEGIIFHRVINEFMIQGGDPTGTGCGGESIYGGAFEDEFTPYLHNIRGALCMANSGPNTNGSQFFIVQATSCPENMLGQMEEMGEERGFPAEAVEDYKNLGGTPWLDFRHTVFGQVTEGMDTVDNIAAVKVGANDKPINDVVIEKIEIIRK
ncbi:MAG: peptidylprolyl isomerase [Clostridiales bacterium]|nr:peptidylprolyl isomerase [Candidatus Equinaster intestinalis]